MVCGLGSVNKMRKNKLILVIALSFILININIGLAHEVAVSSAAVVIGEPGSSASYASISYTSSGVKHNGIYVEIDRPDMKGVTFPEGTTSEDFVYLRKADDNDNANLLLIYLGDSTKDIDYNSINFVKLDNGEVKSFNNQDYGLIFLDSVPTGQSEPDSPTDRDVIDAERDTSTPSTPGYTPPVNSPNTHEGDVGGGESQQPGAEENSECVKSPESFACYQSRGGGFDQISYTIGTSVKKAACWLLP